MHSSHSSMHSSNFLCQAVSAHLQSYHRWDFALIVQNTFIRLMILFILFSACIDLSKLRPLVKMMQFIDLASYKAKSIRLHENSAYHRDAVNHVKKFGKSVHESKAGIAKRALQTEALDKTNKLFRIFHTLAYHHRPLIWLSDYIFQDSLIDAGPNGFYLGQENISRCTLTTFLKYICKDAFRKLKNGWGPFLPLMGDGLDWYRCLREQCCQAIPTGEDGHYSLTL